MSGEALELYVFSVFFLLACSAGDSGAFAAALEHNKGIMRPILQKHLAKGVKLRCSTDAPGVLPLWHDMGRMHAHANDGLFEHPSPPADVLVGAGRYSTECLGAGIDEAVQVFLQGSAALHGKNTQSFTHAAVFRSPTRPRSLICLSSWAIQCTSCRSGA